MTLVLLVHFPRADGLESLIFFFRFLLVLGGRDAKLHCGNSGPRRARGWTRPKTTFRYCFPCRVSALASSQG